MPNWSYNTIAMQGERNAIHAFIKIGLKNSNLPSSDDMEKDFELLVQKATTKITNEPKYGEPVPDDFVLKVIDEQYLSARTFLPMPDTFLLHDTTNEPNKYPLEVVKEQQEKYGAVGWYDYNLKTLGTKWNFGLNDENSEISLRLVDEEHDVWRIVMETETALSVPDAWLSTMAELNPDLFIAVKATEESQAYAFCGVCRQDGIDEVCDLMPFIDNICTEWNNDRETLKNEIRADKNRMDEIRRKIVEENETLSEDKIKDLVEDEIQDILDDTFGDYPDTAEAYEKLDDAFVDMLNENLTYYK